ncbi:MAG: cob(I)yrinic acid a,c-diamide adenosyltransferase [Treponema sp.]|nr:cob(I)yrinic acid a,c-diamide adenosyltransferase [Treponema sp.]
MIHLYHGEGKGKTTAAIGLSVRALGNGIPVVFVQFLKSRNAGEIKMLEKLGAKVLRGKSCGKFTFQMSDEEKKSTRKISVSNFNRALEICSVLSKKNQVLLVLDEICAAWNCNMVDKVESEYLVTNPPENVEIVLTGRNPPEVFLRKADYVTEMKKEKHPYDSGILARKGIEF